MKPFFSAVRGFVAAFVLHVLVLGIGGPLYWILARPLARIIPERMRSACGPLSGQFHGFLLFFVRLGGGRIRLRGRIPADQRCFVLMNHQSVLDIPVAVRIARPRLPAFVTRKRYSRAPIMASLLRFLRWPVVDPDGDPAEAMKVLAGAVKIHPCLLIYPESHRTKTGDIGPFFPAGLWILFKAERRPVYLIVGDGFRACSHWRDLFTSLGEVDGESEVLGPFFPPPPDELRGFINELRETMVAKLAEMKETHGRR